MSFLTVTKDIPFWLAIAWTLGIYFLGVLFGYSRGKL